MIEVYQAIKFMFGKRSLFLLIGSFLFFVGTLHGQPTVLSSAGFVLDKYFFCLPAREAKLTYTGIIPPGVSSLQPDHDFGNRYVVYSPEYIFEWDWGTGFRRSGTGLGPYEIVWNYPATRTVTLTVTSTASAEDKVIKSREIVLSYVDVYAKWRDPTCENRQGEILLTAEQGTAPFQYSIDSLHFQPDSLFIVNPGTYQLTVKDANNCVASKTLTIGGPEDAWVKTGDDVILCPGQQAQISTVSNATTFLWEPSTGLSDPTLKDPVAIPLVTTQYIVTATNNDCMNSARDTVLITVVPDFTIKTTPDSEIESGTPFQLTVSAPGLDQTKNISYVWSPAEGLNHSDIYNPVTTIFHTTVYSVKVVTNEGCVANDKVKLTVRPGYSILIPTAFSPNGDGSNDILKPFIHSNTSLLNFRIYNRWGEVIFFSRNKEQGWDGSYKGTQVSSGSYIYRIEGLTKDQEMVKKEGTVLLIR